LVDPPATVAPPELDEPPLLVLPPLLVDPPLPVDPPLLVAPPLPDLPPVESDVVPVSLLVHPAPKTPARKSGPQTRTGCRAGRVKSLRRSAMRSVFIVFFLQREI
jgi:hypothetical protein